MVVDWDDRTLLASEGELDAHTSLLIKRRLNFPRVNLVYVAFSGEKYTTLRF